MTTDLHVPAPQRAKLLTLALVVLLSLLRWLSRLENDLQRSILRPLCLSLPLRRAKLSCNGRPVHPHFPLSSATARHTIHRKHSQQFPAHHRVLTSYHSPE